MKPPFAKLDCEGRTVLFATGEDGDAIPMIEIRANVTEDGWDTLAFLETNWPGAEERARYIVRCLATHNELLDALECLEIHMRDCSLADSDLDVWKKARAAIARAKGASPLPPDPDGKNDDRASWAGRAVAAFQEATRTDDEDALCDLLADLMHWCDRNQSDFATELDRAQHHYDAETGAEEQP